MFPKSRRLGPPAGLLQDWPREGGQPGCSGPLKGYWSLLPTLLPHPKAAFHLLTPQNLHSPQAWSSGLPWCCRPVLCLCCPGLPDCTFQKTPCHLHAQPGCSSPEDNDGAQWTREYVMESAASLVLEALGGEPRLCLGRLSPILRPSISVVGASHVLV